MDAPGLTAQPGRVAITYGAEPSTADRTPASGWTSPSAWVSFWAAFLTEFTVTLVGEMPVGEFLLIATAAWAGLCVIFNHAWPGELLKSRSLWIMLAAQLIALGGYMASDLYRHSQPHDMARGWSRMIILAVDLIAVAYLFSCARRNLWLFLAGQCLGGVVNALVFGPMFGDMWKFGIGAPLSFLILAVAAPGGLLLSAVAAAGIGVLHFIQDYRGFGGLCLATGMLALMQLIPRVFRLWLAPLVILGTAGAVLWLYQQTQGDLQRTTRSDVERSAMVTAALDAFEESPLIGHGSWFSNTDVYDNFMIIRASSAKEANVGGFAGPNEEPGTVTLHSQILVALAEGGLFGGAFFIVYGAELFGALGRIVFRRHWEPADPLCTLLLLSALWNLFLSPFSGAHRVYIAMACGLILLIRHAGPSPVRPEEEAAEEDLPPSRTVPWPGFSLPVIDKNHPRSGGILK